MTAKIPLAGVVGCPIAHSKSPRLHGHWLKELGIAGHYVPLDVAPEDFAEVMEVLPRAGFVGVNVTLPHKVNALAGARQTTERARRIGAANTLTFLPDGGYEADNTDGYGFTASLTAGAPGWDATDGPVTIFGAGGACRAIVEAMISSGAPEVRLTNRTRARAESLAAVFGPRVKVIDWGDMTPALQGAATVINTTALGMKGQPPFNLDLSAMTPGAVAADIVYTPLETPFLVAAAAHGARTVDGLGMLLWQAAPGFARWFGQEPTITDALRAVVLAE